jgi:hypothetical protein
MALGSKSGKSSKGSKGKGGKKKVSSYRTVGSIWENKVKVDGKTKTILNFNVDNPDEDDEYHQGTLVWIDAKTGKTFKVKSMNVFEAEKGPDELLNKLSINLKNEYQVEELDADGNSSDDDDDDSDDDDDGDDD